MFEFFVRLFGKKVQPVTVTVPQFEHDCDECIFLGRFISQDKDEDETQMDGYICPNGVPTILMRKSSNEEDYSSFPVMEVDNTSTFRTAARWKPFRDAKEVAQRRGLC